MSFPLPKDFTDRMQQMLGDEYDTFIQSYENTNFKQVKVLRPSDNSIQLDWQYVPVTEDVVFEISSCVNIIFL